MYDYTNIVDNIFENTHLNGGCSYSEKHGFIYGPIGNLRYVVGLEDSKVIGLKKFSREDVRDFYLNVYRNRVLESGDLILGTWVNNNRVYLDLSGLFSSFQEARITALKNKQLAIYDLESGDNIYL